VIGAHVEIILIVTGAAIVLARVQFIAPSTALRMVYGRAPEDSVNTALAHHGAD
jgi:hypothetical protein